MGADPGDTGVGKNMTSARWVRAAALAIAAGLSTPATAAAPGRLAPIPDVESASRHAPYEMGQCEVCHDASAGGSAPGPLRMSGNALCFDCHDEFKKTVKGHPAAKTACTSCHSPHNSRKRKLLL
jgi:predicted CXXCH cytochrome family protein